MKLTSTVVAIIFGVLFFNSCNQKTYNSSVYHYVNDSLKNSLIGNWGGLNESIPVWNIKMDPIYYYERSKAYSYKIINNDLIINLPTSQGILKNIYVIIIKDTIFFLDAQGNQIKGYRIKANKS